MRQALIAIILAASLWSFFTSLDSGCGFDPWGQCNPAPQPKTDVGCSADPWGQCNPAPPTIDEGCGMDPFGCPKGS